MEAPEDWIGRTWRATAEMTDEIIAIHRTTFGAILADNAVPPGLHWALAPDIVEMSALGRDGHPRPGLVLPDTGLPRRMWAGGEITFDAPFTPGETVERKTTIDAIERKSGRSGELVFVTVRHVYTSGGAPRLTDRQDLVYREDPTEPAPAPPTAEPWPGATARDITPGPVMLFRYSAVTFNGHRIHYDHPYATGVEGYAGLVVHGPMQALWMMNVATTLMRRLPRTFGYRGRTPLIAGETARVEAIPSENGLDLRVLNPAGGATMTAFAQ